MVRIEDSAVIRCPVEQVWRFLADPMNSPQWYAGEMAVRRTSGGPISVGTTLEAAVQVGGRSLVLGTRVAALDPNREVVLEFTSGPTRGSTDRWRMQAVDDKSTRLTRTFDLRTAGAWRLIQPIIARGARRSHKAEILTIQRILEGQGPEHA